MITVLCNNYTVLMPTISDHEHVLLAALQHTQNLCNHYLDQCCHLQLSQGTSSTVQLHTCHVPMEIQDIMANFRATWEKSKVWLQTDLELLSSKSRIIKSCTFNQLLPRLSHFWLTWGFALLVDFSQLFSTVKPPILRLTETVSTYRPGSFAHLRTLNQLNHQNQLWSFADVW